MKICSDKIAADGKVIALSLNGRMESNLDWRLQFNRAEELVQQGYRLFWELDLGLFSHLRYPLSNEMQFRSLSLCLSHFIEMVWIRFGIDSLGVSLFKGSLPFYLQEENDEIACRDAIANYLNLLGGQLPEEIPAFAIIDSSWISDPVQIAYLLSEEAFMHIKILSNKGDCFVGSENNLPLAICLPAFEVWCDALKEQLDQIVVQFERKKIPIHFIPEFSLTTAWDGLDRLVVVSSGMTAAGKRKLQGFCAAGGEVIVKGEPIGLMQEISFEKWIGEC